MSHELSTRRAQSLEGLDLVREAAATRLLPIVNDEPLAIYVTGSFGRLEARFPKGSDLDLFFLYGPSDRDPDRKLARLTWFRLAGELIGIAKDLDFEDFSRDGEYLRQHNVWHIGKELGSQHEDSENGFTARLLLLLESRYVLNEPLYEALMKETIGFYYGDYLTNLGSFRPTFLINDILRYWRTLLLNYEHKRNRKRHEDAPAEQHTEWRAESALDNLKLRFSRLSTCYSMVSALAAEPTPVDSERVLELCRTAPTDRWTVAAGHAAAGSARSQAEAQVAQILKSYEDFLLLTADSGALLERLKDKSERDRTRRESGQFAQLVSEFLLMTCEGAQLRTLLI